MASIDLTAAEKRTADRLLAEIEVAVGEVAPRDARNSPLISQILEAVNGLRSLVGVVRAH